MMNKIKISKPIKTIVLLIYLLMQTFQVTSAANETLAPQAIVSDFSFNNQANIDSPLALKEAVNLLSQGDLGKIIPYNKDDLLYSSILAKKLIELNIEKIVIVGSAVPTLCFLLILMDKPVVFIDLDELMQDTFQIKYEFLCENIGRKDLPFTRVLGELGELDLSANNIAPQSFDAVLMVDLLGYPPQGSPRKWLQKAKELLKIDSNRPGYLVIDEKEFTTLNKEADYSLREQLPSIFTPARYNLSMIADNYLGVYNYTAGNNSLWEISSTSPLYDLSKKNKSRKLST